MELEEGFRHALNGDAVLFTGAGFSLGARNQAGEDFPLSTGLSQALMSAIGENEAVPLQTAAELYIAKNGAVGLLAFLNRHLGVSEVAAHHRQFARVPWRRAYTTNYDDVFEIAARAEGRSIHVKVAHETDTKLPLDGTSLVHLNGYLPYANPQNLNQSLILAETSYLTTRLIESPWSLLLKSDVEAARAVIFCGYSMADLDIERILVAVESIRRKCMFIVGPSPSLALRTTLSKFGSLCSADLQAAAGLLDSISRTHVFQPLQQNFPSFRRPSRQASNQVSTPTAEDVFNLYVKGDLEVSLLSQSLVRSPPTYIIPRTEVDEVLTALRTGTPAVAIIGRLANGKSIICECIAERARDLLRRFYLRERTSIVSCRNSRASEPVAPHLDRFR